MKMKNNMGLFNILFRRNKFENPAKINWKNIKKFFQGNFFKIFRIFNLLAPMMDYREEQFIWRMNKVKEKSPICFEQGSCKICGCDVEGLALSDPPCEGNCFPKIMSKEEWKQFKKLNNIKI